MLVECKTSLTANPEVPTYPGNKNRPLRDKLFRGLLLIGLFGCIAQADPGTAQASDVNIATYTQCGGDKPNGKSLPSSHTFLVRNIEHDGKIRVEIIDLQIRPGECGNINPYAPFDQTIDPKRATFLGMKIHDSGAIGQYWRREDGVEGFVYLGY